jgi:indolepyruvate decarboxylase
MTNRPTANMNLTSLEVSLGDLVGRVLVESGIVDLFCIPGDFTMQLSRELLTTPGLALRTMSHEYGTTLAALGYAVGKGVPGAVCFTYGVGVLNATNAIAQAYVERVPLLVLSGAPGARERQAPIFLHHTIVDHQTQYRIMKEITVHQVCVTDPHQALEQIREAVTLAIAHSRPVYIEIPRDLFQTRVRYTPARQVSLEPAIRYSHAARQAAEQAYALVRKARDPVFVPGLELKRRGLTDLAMRVCERLAMPWVATPMSRGGIPISHPNYRGIYAGPASPSRVTRDLLAKCDVLMLIGEPNSDVNMGIASHIARGRLIHADDGKIIVGRQRFNASTAEFLIAFAELISTVKPSLAPLSEEQKAFIVQAPDAHYPLEEGPLTPFDIINELNRHFAVSPDTQLVVDCGDVFFMSLGMFPADVLTSPLYMSMGIAVPGAMGYQLGTGKRPIVLVGDGAFHMTGNELMRAAKFGLSPIVIVLNNQRWASLSSDADDLALTEQLPMSFSAAGLFLQVQAFTATTGAELRLHLAEALAMDKPVLIDAQVNPAMRSYLCERFFDAVKSQQHLPKA